MSRLCCVALTFALLSGCADDRVALRRGPLGPASYRVDLAISGAPAVRDERVSAELTVEREADGAKLTLVVAGEDPVVAELRDRPGGRLALETVQGITPGAAGEADLASLVGQLDPPLPPTPVRLGDGWSATRRIATDTLDATLRIELQLERFRRVGGIDTAEFRGEITGELEAEGPAGPLEGTVRGETRIAWSLEGGRVAESETLLVWTTPGGALTLEAKIRPG